MMLGDPSAAELSSQPRRTDRTPLRDPQGCLVHRRAKLRG